MDSWENDDSVNSTTNQMSNLNVEAAPFVPGLNINARAFVPGGFAPTPQVQPAAVGDTKTEDDSPGASANWEEDPALEQPTGTASGSDSKATTPDDDEEDESEERETTKKKPKKTSEDPEEEQVDFLRKESVNLVFIGHVDAGKSTIGGHMLFLTGMIDKRTLEKFEKEAKDKNRESWYLSYALDTNEEERLKGKTVECGRAHFETTNKHFVLLDAPGHKLYVPNMISGANQADLAILVISARRGEFETGFEKGGQTREHATLVKTAGVKHLIVAINKMDDPTVNWDEDRYNECRDKLIPFLKTVGFNPKTELFFLPCSGLTGAYLKDAVPESVCSWYQGPSLIDYLDGLPSLTRSKEGPLRLPVADKYKDMGVFISGKVESGSFTKGQQLVLMPNKVNVEAVQIYNDEEEVESVAAGDNVKVKLRNVEEDDVSNGFVLCTSSNLCKIGNVFDAQFVILEYKTIICPGFSAMMHLHSCVEDVTLKALACTLNKRTSEKKEMKPRFIRQGDVAIGRFMINGGSICMETFKDFQQMGRFTLRDEGKTIAIGKILKVFPVSNEQ